MESIQTELNLYGLKFPKQETKLTKLEQKVFKLIPVGRENAITGAYIAKTLHISTRHVIELVRRLRLKHCDIGSTTNEGYYRFKDAKEYSEFMNKYSKEQARKNQVIQAMKATPIAQQIVIDLNNEWKRLTMILKDAVVFLKDAEADPIIGSISYEKPVKPNTALFIDAGNKTVVATIKQVELAIFKLDSKVFGFIFKNGACYDATNFNYWDKETAKYAGRKLHECFDEVAMK